MLHIIQLMKVYEAILIWVAVASTIALVLSLMLVPFFIVRIPSDYFARGSDYKKLWADQHALISGLLVIAKNLLGYIFVMAGIIMLALPGQGLLTILIGIMLLDFPGKQKLVRWVISRQTVLRSVNWIRRQAGREPLVLEE